MTSSVTPPPGSEPSAPLGRIITFYSYKGGTGRSMALANVAWLLALNGYRVLVIDWDLEAPGVHRYFHPFLDDKELQSTEGLIDMVESLAAQAAASSEPLNTDQVDIINYVEPLEWPRNSAYQITWKQFGPRAGIDLMPAGRQGPTYSRKLSAFNWIDFYERLGGRRLLDAAKHQMRTIYDYVLIDSRTGVSDTSGICTIEMPDTLVLCFTLNDQSIRGAARVAESVRERRPPAMSGAPASPGTPGTSAGPLRIFPVPTRVEMTSERDKREAALDVAQKTFAPCLNHLPLDAHGRYWGAVQMAYFPYYAFEEIPAVFADKPDELLSLSTTIKQLTRAITDPPVGEMPALAADAESAEKLRKEIVRWYLRPVVRQADAIHLAQQIFESFDESKRAVMRRTLLRLVSIGPTSGPSPKSAVWDEIRSSDQWMAELLAERRLLVSTEGERPRTVRFRDPVVCEKWETLRHWVDEDRRFLLWRAAVAGSLESWHLSEHDDNTLLRGKLLDDAPAWLRDRSDDLNEAERRYIDESIASAERLKNAQDRVAVQAAEAQARVDQLENLLKQSTQPVAPLASKPPRWWERWTVWTGAGGTTVLLLLVVIGMQSYQTYRDRTQQAQQVEQAQVQLAKTQAELDAQRRLVAEQPMAPAANPTSSSQGQTAVASRRVDYRLDLATQPDKIEVSMPAGPVRVVIWHRLPGRAYTVIQGAERIRIPSVPVRLPLTGDCVDQSKTPPNPIRDEEDVRLAADRVRKLPTSCLDRDYLRPAYENAEPVGPFTLARDQALRIDVQRLKDDKTPERVWTVVFTAKPVAQAR